MRGISHTWLSARRLITQASVKPSNLVARVLTAVVTVPLLLALLLWGPPWGWYGLVFMATAVASLEFFAMTHPLDPIARACGVATTLSVSAAIYFGAHDPRAVLSAVLGSTLLGLLLPLWRLGEVATSAIRIVGGIAGPLYIGGLLVTIALLRRDHGVGYVFLSLSLAWFADTGGYFFGRFLGKRKLYEAVSPKKTRAGFVGAVLGSALGALLAHAWYLNELPLVDALLLGVIAGALGQLGDLSESLLKRATGIKDSGAILPGHGGLLDRIDALLVVSTLVYLYAIWR